MKFIKKYWLFFALAALAAFLAFLWFQGERMPKSPTPTPLPKLPKINLKLEGQSIGKNIPITIEATPNLPQELSIFRVTPKVITKNDALAISQRLGFTQQPTEVEDAITGKQLIWSGGPKFLFVNLSPVDILFGIDPEAQKPANDGQLPLPVAMFTSLEETLRQLRLDAGPDSKKISQTVGAGQLLEIGLSPVVGGLVVVGPDPIKPLISARYDRSGGLYRLTYDVGFVSPKIDIAYPAKTLEEIKEALPKEGKIVYLGETEEVGQIFASSIQINNIEPSLLFLKHEPNTLYPVFILKGKAQTNEGEQPISISIPASKSQYLNSE